MPTKAQARRSSRKKGSYERQFMRTQKNKEVRIRKAIAATKSQTERKRLTECLNRIPTSSKK